MNFIKKKIILLAGLTLFIFNIRCMEEKMRSHSRFQGKATKIMYNPFTTLKNLENITQIASIALIDSKREDEIKSLALARGVVNLLRIMVMGQNIHDHWEHVKITHIPLFLTILIRGYNWTRDFKNWGNASVLAFQNKAKKYNKNLKNQKIKHYIWLTLNTIIPSIAEQLTDKKWMLWLSSNLAIYSEFYRQSLMYALIEKP